MVEKIVFASKFFEKASSGSSSRPLYNYSCYVPLCMCCTVVQGGFDSSVYLVSEGGGELRWPGSVASAG